jgi:hypothetical protein
MGLARRLSGPRQKLFETLRAFPDLPLVFAQDHEVTLAARHRPTMVTIPRAACAARTPPAPCQFR